MRDKCPFCKVGRLVIDSVPPKMKHESQTDQFYEQVSRRRLQCNHCFAVEGYVDLFFHIKQKDSLDHIPNHFQMSIDLDLAGRESP